MIELPKDLAQYSVQEIQFELLRRAGGTGFKPEQIINFLHEHRDLWKAVMMDRIFVTPHRATHLIFLPLLYKLRDLPDNVWNADTLYVLAPDHSSAKQLTELGAARELWNLQYSVRLYDEAETAKILPYYNQKGCLFSIWWD